jgi:hypothetical protein
MLDRCYSLSRLFMAKGWIVGVLSIPVTVGFGTNGFVGAKREVGSDLSLADALDKAISLLAVRTGAVRTASVWQLELARKRYASEFVRSTPRVPALAVYAIVIVEPILRRPR